MSTSQYALNLGLLAWILASGLGTRPLTRARLLFPLLVVVGVASAFLGAVPTRGNDVRLEVVLTATGVVLGVVAGLATAVRRVDGVIVTRAGLLFAAVWITVIGGRIAFAYGAEHWFPHAIARFSRTHLITGADAWTAGFVLMALAMVLARVAVTAVRAALLARAAEVQDAPAAATAAVR